ncbi:MAG: tRNA lysidine(34) synthetase TilS [Lactobacillaceae bacterium]|jgi:tRNA(Ile)-lysidine synthase|nr:tRNA lysidine(34) synthetase TilS [Lactobacillaceae bacterium]
MSVDLYRQFQLNVQKEKLLTGKDKVVIGISGGVDSMILANLMVRYFQHPEKQIFLAHVNYHLRDNSDDESHLIEEFAKKHNIIAELIDWNKPQNSNSIERQARDFRYNFYEQVATKYGAKKIVLAHHANDQAETILLKLIRGGDWTQFAGMSFIRPTENGSEIIRPLLNISKTNIINYAQLNQIEWVEDQTNFDPDYTARNTIRNLILPEMEKLNNKAVEHISDFGQFITNLESEMLPEMLRRWIKNQIPSQPLKEQQLEDFANLIQNSKKPYGKIELENGVFLKKEKNDIKIHKIKT